MKKILIITILGIITIFLLSAPITFAGPDAVNHEVVMSTKSDGNIGAQETITLKGSTDDYIDTISFWIQNGASGVSIVVNSTDVTYTNDGTTYTVNISTMKIKTSTQFIAEINYTLDKNTQNFQKVMLRNTDSMKVTFDGKILYMGTNLVNGSSSTISINSTTITIYKTAETTTESPNNYYTVIAVLLVLIAVFLLYNLKRRKPSKIKEMASATEELLTTKKALLMSLLKDIEKQHRAKEISDETYHKLKEQYKEEAVITMKQLDDMKPKA